MSMADAYEDGMLRLSALLRGLGDEVDMQVPLTPAWRIRDVLGHLVGLAEDSLAGNYPEVSEPKRRPEQAVQREVWTQAQVDRRSDWSVPRLLEHWTVVGERLERLLRAEHLPAGYPQTIAVGPTFDLSCHLHDVRHALDRPEDRDALTTRIAFGVSRSWLGLRLGTAGLAALRLRSPEREWTVGNGEPGATLTGTSFDLFRSLSGRRSVEQLLDLKWDGDPAAYIDVLSPYPCPHSAVRE